MKKILISLMAIALVIGLVGAGVVAYFSDEETSTGNTFAAGTLDLQVDGVDDPLPTKFTLGPLAPGNSGTVTYSLANLGNIAGFVDLQGVTVANAGGASTEPELAVDPGNAGNLSANIYVIVTLGATQIYAGLLNGFAGDWDVSEPIGGPGAINCVIDWVVDQDNVAPLGADVGNDIQGDIATVGITFELAQTAGQ